MMWANYGETACLFCLIFYLLLAKFIWEMSKRSLGMDHYKQGSRRSKKLDYLLDQRCIKGLPY